MNRNTFEQLSPRQQFWYARVMIDMILADGRVHASERTYLDVIFDLFEGQEEELAELRRLSDLDRPAGVEAIKGLRKPLAKEILKDCVSVAISDGDFHENERRLISQVGQSMSCSPQEITEVLNWGNELMGHIFQFAS